MTNKGIELEPHPAAKVEIVDDALAKAADRIEALEATLRDCNGLFAKIIEQRVRIEALETALRSIADGSFPGSIAALDRGGAALASMMQEIARAALAPEQDK